jgi:hypothetical protein
MSAAASAVRMHGPELVGDRVAGRAIKRRFSRVEIGRRNPAQKFGLFPMPLGIGRKGRADLPGRDDVSILASARSPRVVSEWIPGQSSFRRSGEDTDTPKISDSVPSTCSPGLSMRRRPSTVNANDGACDGA